MALLPIADALRLILDGVSTLEAQSVPIGSAAYRTLAEPVVALRTQPPFDASAMDGYAVRGVDVAEAGQTLSVIGESAAGSRFARGLSAGQAVRIFTGAPVPEGADTVILQEDTKRLDGGRIAVAEPTAQGRHIRKAGLDFREGDVLLPAGRLLDAGALSLAAAGNHPSLNVIRRPIIGIVATGDELVLPGETPGPDQIVASNALGIAALVRRAGAEVRDFGIVPDDRKRLKAAFGEALESCDVLVTLGGASVGDHDLVRGVLEAQGMDLAFWKIAMRPGKPLMFGHLHGRHVLGLPGNPVSSLVCAHLFLLPLIAHLGGTHHRPDVATATLSTGMDANDQRQDYVRAAVQRTGRRLTVRPLGLQDSSMLRTMARADALIVRPPFAPPAPMGSPVQILMLR